jgi:hypothetical protein
MFSTIPASSDFTVECWFYLNNVTATQQLIMSHRNASTGANAYVPFLIWAATSTLTLYISSNNSSWNIVNGSSLGTVTANQWYHVALCRANGVIRAFVNGLQKVTVNNVSAYTTTQPFQVGMSTGETNSALNGYVCDVRFLNGQALYPTNFLPPVSPLQSLNNTTLLLNFNNPGVFDSSGMSNFENVGNAIINTTSMFGVSSIYFPGTSYLLGTTNNALLLTGDFTIEMWFKGGTQTGTMPLLLSKNAAYSSGIFYIAYSHQAAPNKISLHNTTNGSPFMTHNTVVTDGLWHHVAVVRIGTTVNLYVDGVSSGTPYTSSVVWDYSIPVVGNNPSDGGATTTQLGFVGNIDDLRITNGLARYTAGFTTPGPFAENGPLS